MCARDATRDMVVKTNLISTEEWGKQAIHGWYYWIRIE